MGKGSGRRSGTGYEDGWSRIFDKKYKQEQQAKNAELRAMLDAMPLAKPVKCTEPFDPHNAGNRYEGARSADRCAQG